MGLTGEAEDRRVWLPPRALATHLVMIGQPGTGKSRALEALVMQQIKAGQGVGVIDPHGELFDHLLSRVAQFAWGNPSLAERLVIINPVDRNWTVGFNPLESIPGYSTERLAGFLTDVVIKIWKIDATNAPRMIRLLMHTFLALAELELGLVALPRFLIDTDWRENLLLRIRHPDVLSYFRHEFPQKGGSTHQWITPVLNKVAALLFDPDLRLMFSTRATIHFRQILDRGLVLLVNTSKGVLGEGNSALLGAFIVAHIQKAALARADGTHRAPFFLYLDEFQNYTTDNIQDILSESRKYGLSLVLAHQYLDQLPPHLLGAVLNTTGTLACFRVGYQDASLLAHELFPPKYLMHFWWELHFMRFGKFPMPLPIPQSEPVARDELVTLLTQLDRREFVAKRRGPYPPVKLRTFDMPTPVMTEELWEARAQLMRISGERYGRLKCQVREEVRNDPIDINPVDISYYEQIPPAALPAGE